MAFVRLLKLNDWMSEWSLAIALSLALETLITGTLLYLGIGSPVWSLIILICLSIIGAALQVVTLHRLALVDNNLDSYNLDS